MEENCAYVVIAYSLFSFCVVYPPNELLQLGFSIQNIFSSLLGSEQLYFIYYHMIRISLSMCVHSLLPIGIY